MEKRMKITVLIMLLEQLVKLLTPDMLKAMLDAGFDAIENYVAKSENKIDDSTLIPLINTMRAAFSIPDND
jgi:hypothetical protein